MGIFFNNKNQLDVKFILSIIVVLVILPLAIYSFYASQEPTSTNYSVEILNQCGVDFECTISSLEGIAKTKDQTIVLETFDEIMTIYDENSYYCHVVVHHMAFFFVCFFWQPSTIINKCQSKMWRSPLSWSG